MYIDLALQKAVEHRHGKVDLERLVEECGIWYPSPDAVRAEQEDFEMTLEEIFSEMYYVIIDNKFHFVSPNEFLDDVNKYIHGE